MSQNGIKVSLQKAFCCRTVLRSLPILTESSPLPRNRLSSFWYWPKKDRFDFLLSITTSFHLAYYSTLVKDSSAEINELQRLCQIAANYLYYLVERTNSVDSLSDPNCDLYTTLADEDDLIDYMDEFYSDEQECEMDYSVHSAIFNKIDEKFNNNETVTPESLSFPVLLKNINQTLYEKASVIFAISHLSNLKVAFKNLKARRMITSFSTNRIWNDTLIKVRNIEYLQILKNINLNEYITQPLWLNKQPEEWTNDWNVFAENIRNLHTDLVPRLDWFEERIQGKEIDIELLERQAIVPGEMRDNGIRGINKYLLNVRYACKPLNRVRAIFLGHGSSGKTSLIQAINGKEIKEGVEPATPGIDISEWKLPTSEVKAIFWDFGGQIMAHSTHRFFLRERCLYILIIDSRSEIDATTQAEYWLDHILSFGRKSRVIIVGNKWDISPVNIDMQFLKNKHSNIVGFFPLSCLHYKSKLKQYFDSFLLTFENELKKVGTHQILFTKNQFDVLEKIIEESQKKAFLTNQEYDVICKKNKIPSSGIINRRWLLSLLDKLGVIIHFKDLIFDDAYVLNPRWLTYGCYKLIYSDLIREKLGILLEKDIVGILNSDVLLDEHNNILSYPPEKCRFIIEAMEIFKLCYRIPNNSSKLVFPSRLPTNTPDHKFPILDSLNVKYKFRGLLPQHITTNFIVAQHKEVSDDMVWQNGVVTKSKNYNAKALLYTDYYDRTINLSVNGYDSNEYYHIIREKLSDILDIMPNIKYEEVIKLDRRALILDDSENNLSSLDHWAPYKQLFHMHKDGMDTYVTESGHRYNLNKVLKNMTSKKKDISSITNYNKINIGSINTDAFIQGGFSDSTLTINKHTLSQNSGDLNEALFRIKEEIQQRFPPSETKDIALDEIETVMSTLYSIEESTLQDSNTATCTLRNFASGLSNKTSKCLSFLTKMKKADELIPWIVDKSIQTAELLENLINT